MKVIEKNVMRLVAVQHIRTAYGIKTKNWSKNKGASCKTATSSSVSKGKLPPVFACDNLSETNKFTFSVGLGLTIV